MHNFDEASLKMGIIGSMKVVIGSDRHANLSLFSQAIASRLQPSRASVLLGMQPYLSSSIKGMSTSLIYRVIGSSSL
jgi:hypothetical protein